MLNWKSDDLGNAIAMHRFYRCRHSLEGLEPDDIQGLPFGTPGQGGVEFPYEAALEAAAVPTKGSVQKTGLDHAALPGHVTMGRKISEIKSGLDWLSHQSKVESQILDKLSDVAEKKAVQWASTPSIWPVNGSITSRFGPRLSPFTGKKALHAGLDIGARKGTEIRAPGSGKVVVAAYDGRMGKFIRIDHGYDIETTYGHLSKILVKYGDRVHRGDLIGLVGSTGKFSTGPHLHYQVAVNDKVVNPIDYILD